MDSAQGDQRIVPTVPSAMENATTLKVLSLFVLLIIAVIGGAIPVVLVRTFENGSSAPMISRRNIKRIISIMNAFSGGVFLAIALIHLLPEVEYLFEYALKDATPNGTADYPWAGLCASCGFFLIVLIEQIIYTFQERMGSLSDLGLIHGHSHHHSRLESKRSDSSPSTNEQDFHLETLDQKVRKDEEKGIPSETPPTDGSVSVLSAVVLSLALSVHSVLEGLALGLQLTRAGTLDLLIALSLHKGIESFTISLNVVQATTNKLAKYLTLLLFSVTSPVGIAIGIPLTSRESAESPSMLLVNGILQGLATGTFMFVTFIEILPTELSAKGDRMLKFLFMIVGFGIIAAVTSLEFS